MKKYMKKSKTISMLREWIDLLQRIEKDEAALAKFDMNWWGENSGRMAKKPVCATAACAGGWATVIPSFKKAGLRLVQEPNTKGSIEAYLYANGATCAGAICKVTGISFGQAEEIIWSLPNLLHGEKHTITPTMVVARIERVIAQLESA